MFYHMLIFIRYIEVYFTFALVDCVRYNEDFVKSTGSVPYILRSFGRTEENRSLYRGLRYIDVR